MIIAEGSSLSWAILAEARTMAHRREQEFEGLSPSGELLVGMKTVVNLRKQPLGGSSPSWVFSLMREARHIIGNGTLRGGGQHPGNS